MFGPKNTRPYFVRLVIWLAKIGLIVFVFVALAKWINGPSKGVIIKKQADPRASVVIENNSYTHYDGKLISLDYKPTYLEQKEENNLNEGDRLILFGDKGSSNRITVMAQPVTNTNLDEVSAVQMRRTKKDLYEESNIEIDGSPALLFKKKDEFERVAVVIKDNKMLSVAMVAVSNDTELDQEYTTLLNSIKWK